MIVIEKLKAYPKREALKDIAQWLKNRNANIHNPTHEIWEVNSVRLDTKQTRRLNRLLGIHSINKGIANMSRN